jgi:HEPN domain-containing protein
VREATLRWLKKSDHDFRTMKVLHAAHDSAMNDAVCFHAQQSIEKLLKALCIEQEISFPKSHDLKKLVNLLISIYPTLEILSDNLKDLTELGLEFRYPDEFASQKDADRAVALCAEIRLHIKDILGPMEGMLFS